MNNSIRPSIYAGLVRALVVIALLASASASAQAALPIVLQVTSSAANTSGNILTIDDSHFNAKPSLNLIVTQTVFSGTPVFNNNPVGVFYNVAAKRWTIFNEDGVAIPPGAVFNVLVPKFATRINGGTNNSFANQTFFTFRKRNANALLLQTHVYDPFPMITNGVFNGIIQGGPVGFFFNPIVTTTPIPPSSGCWSVFNENVLVPALAAAYTVADVTKAGTTATPYSFIFTTDASNIVSTFATITNPLTNAKPNAVLFASHISTTGGPVFDKFFAVGYDGNWVIIDEDNSTMPTGISFVVTAFPAVTGS